MSRLSIIKLFGTSYPMEVTNDISEHGVKFTQREFIVPVEDGEVDFSVRSYPKNTHVVIEYWDDRCSPDDDGFTGPLVKALKYPNGVLTHSDFESIVKSYGEPTGKTVDELF